MDCKNLSGHLTATKINEKFHTILVSKHDSLKIFFYNEIMDLKILYSMNSTGI